MQSKDGDAIDAIDWESWRPTRPTADGRRSRLPSMLLAIVILGHGLVVWFAWRDDIRRMPAAEVDEALLINFIERPAEHVSAQRPTERRRTASSPHQSARTSRVDSEPRLQVTVATESPAAPLRLRLEADPWNMPQSPAARNLSSDRASSRHDLVLHYVDPRLRALKIRERTSPKQALAMLGAFFGSPPYDPCPQISARLANLHSERHELDLAADLETRERRCQR